MNQALRLRFGVGIPVALHRDPREGLLSYSVGLRVGPFATDYAARTWEEKLIWAATLGWDKLSQTKNFPTIEARTISGPLVLRITGIPIYAISVSSPSNMSRKLMVTLEVGETAVEKYVRESPIVFDIDPEENSPEEVALELESHSTKKALDILQKRPRHS